MPTLSTYIAFPGNAREAFEHYRDVFGGELTLVTYGDGDLGEMTFTPDPASVAHAILVLPGGTITGGDAAPGDQTYALRDTAYSLLYTADDVERQHSMSANSRLSRRDIQSVLRALRQMHGDQLPKASELRRDQRRYA